MAAAHHPSPLAAEHGAAIAVALLLGDEGSTRERHGWRAHLTAATLDADEDPALLHLMDDIARRSRELTEPEAIANYAREAQAGAGSAAARAVLGGMVAAADPSAAGPPPRPRPLRSTVSVREAAEALGKTDITIRKWVASGALEATKLGPRDLRIYPDSFPLSGDGRGGVFDPDWGLYTRLPMIDPAAPGPPRT